MKLIIGFAFVLSAVNLQAQDREIPVPNEKQLAYQQAELGVVFHYDLHVFDTTRYIQGVNRVTPVADYNIFNPTKLDVEQWVITAKQAGAKFAILTATHETGFALFQSDFNPYSLRALKWKEGKADLLRDFVDACRKHGLKPGIYLGIRWNSFFGVHDFVVDGTGEMQKRRQKYYNKMVEGMLTEICTNYGPLFMIWFDGGAGNPENGTPDVLPIVRKYQPNALFYHNDQLAEMRWAGSETGTVGYPNWSTFPVNFTGSGESAPPMIAKDNFALLKHGDMMGKYWVPTMADAPLRGYNSRHEWFWEPNNEQHIFPLKNLIDMYYNSVGRNSTLILGLTPDNRGLIPDSDVVRLKEFGNEIKKRFESPIASISGKGLVLELKLKKKQFFNQIVLQENIKKGHLIKKFHIEINKNGHWKTVLSGTSIGHKYIHVFEKPLESNKIRVVVDESFQNPDFKLFSAYYIKK